MDIRGYIHPESSFATIKEWEQIAKQFLALQKKGVDTRGGQIDSDPQLSQLVQRWFGFLLHVEVQRWDQLTQRDVLNFIEDFVNHKVWGLRKEFHSHFYNDERDVSYLDDIKVAYFYSRGDIEPYVLIDGAFTSRFYGSTDLPMTTMHWTTEQGLINLQDSINTGHSFAISTFTKQWKPFFRKESNVLLKLEGSLCAAFKSDVKSYATDGGNRTVNMLRLAYPGGGSNLCLDPEQCTGGATSLWNELIVKPTKLIAFKKITRY